MNVLIVDPLHNSPGEHDDSGAFELGAEKLALAFGADATRFSFDNTFGYETRFAALLSFVTNKRVDAIVEVSHGQHARLQSGVTTFNSGSLLAGFAAPAPKVAVLFACSAASSPIDSSIAYQLARGGLEVLAHSTVGHAYLNPYVVHVRPPLTPDAQPTHDYIVAPGSAHLWRAWVAYLRGGGWLALARFAVMGGEALSGMTDPTTGFYRDLVGFIRWAPP